MPKGLFGGTRPFVSCEQIIQIQINTTTFDKNITSEIEKNLRELPIASTRLDIVLESPSMIRILTRKEILTKDELDNYINEIEKHLPETAIAAEGTEYEVGIVGILLIAE